MKSWNNTILQTLERHPVHPFPARMAPGIALDALENGAPPLKVLDPMMGSGTVLAVAKSRGHRAYGCDLDPLAVLLTKAWTTTVVTEDAQAVAREILDRAKDRFQATKSRDAYPEQADEETKRFLRYWFDDYARRQLDALSKEITQHQADRVKDHLWVAFSRLIITKQSGASRAMDLSHSRPHRAFDRAPVKPFQAFIESVTRVANNCPKGVGGKTSGPPAHVKVGDARLLKYKPGMFDLVITSPPYLNAIDYFRCSKFSLVWMGYSLDTLRGLRSTSIGSERSQTEAASDPRVRDILQRLELKPMPSSLIQRRLCRYIRDITCVIGQITRVLRPEGRAIVVIGDSTIQGTFIRNSAIVGMAAEQTGLHAAGCEVRDLPPNRRYLPPPSTQGNNDLLNGRMRQEVVMSFRKAS